MDAQAKEIKNKVMCEINSFAIVYFFFDERHFTNYKLARVLLIDKLLITSFYCLNILKKSLD
jgi:hypothetical protein